MAIANRGDKGQWSVVSGQLSVVSGQLSVVSQNVARAFLPGRLTELVLGGPREGPLWGVAGGSGFQEFEEFGQGSSVGDVFGCQAGSPGLVDSVLQHVEAVDRV